MRRMLFGDAPLLRSAAAIAKGAQESADQARADTAAQAATTDQLAQQGATLAMLVGQLQQVATTLGAAVPNAEVEHAHLQAQIDTLVAGLAANGTADTASRTAMTQAVAAIQGTVTQQGATDLAAHTMLQTSLAAAVARLAALETHTTAMQRVMVTTTTALALGATVNMPVVWPAPFPDAAYAVIPVPDAATGLGAIAPAGITNRTATGCTLGLKANVALAAGFRCEVIGFRVT